MNLLFIVPQLYPKYCGGHEIFNYYLIKSLSEKYKITFISNYDIELNNTRCIKINTRNKFCHLIHLQYLIIKYSARNYVTFVTFSKSRWYNWIIYPVINLFFKTKYIVIIHGGGLYQWKFQTAYKIFFKLAYKIVGVSNKICEEYSYRLGLELDFVPPLIPFITSEFSKEKLRESISISTNAKVFIYVGSLKPIKNPKIIINALDLLSKEYIKKNNIILLILGDGEQLTDLKNEVFKKGLQENILFLGIIPREKICDFYKLADFYIISSCFEGTPMSLLEAMFNQLPIIASNVRGINSIIGENNGKLFQKDDISGLADCIKFYIENPLSATNYGKLSYQTFLNNYNYSIMLNYYIDIIDKLYEKQ